MHSPRRHPTLGAVAVAGVVLLSSCGGGSGAREDALSSSGPGTSAVGSSSVSGAVSGSPSGSGSALPPGPASADRSSDVPSPAATAISAVDTDLASAEPAPAEPASAEPASSPPDPTTTVGEPVESTSGSTPGPVAFRSTVSEIDDALAQRMAASWHDGCPVPLDGLRYLTMTYRGFDGADHPGEMVVAATVADDVVSTFRALYDAGYPIASMRLVDDFGADDDASMAADNTSAFNCRPVTGGSAFSEHSYGTAVDVNPVENPYVRGSTVLPAAGTDYTSRPDLPGVIQPAGAAVAAFAAIGWSWGGAWSNPVDYQHFSLSGR